MSNATLITIIQDSGLEDSDKQQWAERVEAEGASPALINELRAAIRVHQERISREAAEIIAEDPELADTADELNADIDAATIDFEADMKGLQKEADAIATEASRTIEKLTAEEKLENISSDDEEEEE